MDKIRVENIDSDIVVIIPVKKILSNHYPSR